MERVGSRTPCECVDWNDITLAGEVYTLRVALLVSAWIEIASHMGDTDAARVALLVSAWIEIVIQATRLFLGTSRTPCECVDWNC